MVIRSLYCTMSRERANSLFNKTITKGMWTTMKKLRDGSYIIGEQKREPINVNGIISKRYNK